MSEPNTREKIVALAEQLIRTRGYSGFSFKDIAVPLNIKNAAIHYYFPTKKDLGIAVLEDIFDRSLLAVSDSSLTNREKLLRFVASFERSREKGLVCIMGALGPGYGSLPDELQEAAKAFAGKSLDWLKETIERGVTAGEFSIATTPEVKAQVMVATMMSGLLLGRILGDDVFENLKNEIINELNS